MLVEPVDLVNEVQKAHQVLQVTSFYQTVTKLVFQGQPVKPVSRVKLVLMALEVLKEQSVKPVAQVKNATKLWLKVCEANAAHKDQVVNEVPPGHQVFQVLWVTLVNQVFQVSAVNQVNEVFPVHPVTKVHQVFQASHLLRL